MRGNVQRVDMLLAVEVSDVANSVGGHDAANLVKICPAVRLQSVQRVDERQAHATVEAGVLLDDVTLGAVVGMDTVVEFHDELGAARQRLVLACHVYIILNYRKNAIEKTC